MVGIRCSEPAPGYFLAPLDFYLYEAENAAPLDTKCSYDLVGDCSEKFFNCYELAIFSFSHISEDLIYKAYKNHVAVFHTL